MLPDRTVESFSAWLRAHLGTAVICRDHAGGYAEGAREVVHQVRSKSPNVGTCCTTSATPPTVSPAPTGRA
ncbi:hypothetical protein ACFPM0_36740 [Pseudonocardia sulfidoxydans]